MKNIILDTNMVMAVAQFKLDVMSELDRICLFPYKVSVLDKTIDELKTIQLRKGRDSLAASLALQLVPDLSISVLKTGNGYVDDILTEMSKDGFIVATVDSELKKRIKKPYITLRKKKHFILNSNLYK